MILYEAIAIIDNRRAKHITPATVATIIDAADLSVPTKFKSFHLKPETRLSEATDLVPSVRPLVSLLAVGAVVLVLSLVPPVLLLLLLLLLLSLLDEEEEPPPPPGGGPVRLRSFCDSNIVSSFIFAAAVLELFSCVSSCIMFRVPREAARRFGVVAAFDEEDCDKVAASSNATNDILLIVFIVFSCSGFDLLLCYKICCLSLGLLISFVFFVFMFDYRVSVVNGNERFFVRKTQDHDEYPSLH
jgi:hypothetical protein